MNEHIKNFLDGASVAAAVASFLAQWLPPLAALVSLLWTLINEFTKRPLCNGGLADPMEE
jgi:hypothetical protein